MANKQKEYDRGRADGLMFAYRLVKEGGEKALADHIRLRGYFGGKISPFTAEEIDDMARQIKELTTTGLRVAMIAVLRDEFGFGKVRVQRNHKAHVMRHIPHENSFKLHTWRNYPP